MPREMRLNKDSSERAASDACVGCVRWWSFCLVLRQSAEIAEKQHSSPQCSSSIVIEGLAGDTQSTTHKQVKPLQHWQMKSADFTKGCIFSLSLDNPAVGNELWCGGLFDVLVSTTELIVPLNSGGTQHFGDS